MPFVGVIQEASTLALRPKLGWGMRKGSDLDRLFVRLSKYQPFPSLDGPDFDDRIRQLKADWRWETIKLWDVATGQQAAK